MAEVSKERIFYLSIYILLGLICERDEAICNLGKHVILFFKCVTFAYLFMLDLMNIAIYAAQRW
jgi:hypothetical protein